MAEAIKNMMAPNPQPSGSKNLLGASWAAAFALGSTTAIRFIGIIRVFGYVF